MVNPEIFRQYDIRGIVDEDLTNESVYLIAKGFGTFLRNRKLQTVTLGGDARLSTPRFKDQFLRGLLETGCDVIDVGIMATPTLYFSIWALKTDAGAMITASHNPPAYNGIKLNRGLVSVYGEEIQEILHIIQSGNFAKGSGTLHYNHDMPARYMDYIVNSIHLAKPMKCVVDAGNGAGGPYLPAILKRLGCEVKELYCEMDGTFPNHHPDPTILENMQDLVREMKTGKWDVGLGLDGDADRIGIIDEKGQMVYGDQILNILARDYLAENPGGVVVADVKCSKNLFDDITKHGGKPIMYKTGHANIKGFMKAEGIRMGGEMSGHMFIGDRYLGFDDAIYACARIVEILSKSPLKMSEQLADEPKMFNTPEIRFDTLEETKFAHVERVCQSFKEDGFDVNDIDGVRVTFPDGWGLVRASNTQPVLVMRFEATTEARMHEIQKLFEERLKKYA
jgi:phosphomannomutase/phosphoglucomutase